MTDYSQRLEEFIDIVTEANKKEYEEKFSNLTPPTFTLVSGTKFDKIVETSPQVNTQFPPSTRVWGFVAKKEFVYKNVQLYVGDLMKPASWKQPAKYPRGNILESLMYGWEPIGVNYL